MNSSVTSPPPEYPPIGANELVLGLVYGSGAEAEPFQTLLGDTLQRYGYELRTIHLSDYLAPMLGNVEFKRERPDATRELQNMGDRLRKCTGKKEILALLGVFLLVSKRQSDSNDGRRVAWLLRSLKRPEEVQALRTLYGPRFILFALHVPEPLRLASAEKRWQRWANVTNVRFEEEATKDIRRDEQDPGVDYGQSVRETFAEADFFVDGRSKSRLEHTLPRTVRIMFGEPFEPPERDEQAMYHAFTAGLRSAEMGRQVGAAIVHPRGEILAVGANEVPSAGGGLYWSPDEPDGRDFADEPAIDSNTLWQRRISRELLVRMRRTNWLNADRATDLGDDAYDIDEDELDEYLKDVKPTRFSSLTEFGRAVHAEMDALTTAARNGVTVRGATVVCTTFPCHNCTRHLIAAGIARIVYMLPYAKSLARDLHRDAVEIEPEHAGGSGQKVALEQYIGVAPRVYPQYYAFVGREGRKSSRGQAMRLPKLDGGRPRVLDSGGGFTFGGPTFPATRVSELELPVMRDFTRLVEASGLKLPRPATEKDER
jgi:cytidine deaminase